MVETQLAHFEETPLIGVLRGITGAQLIPVVETAVESGISTIELTFDTPGVVKLLKKADRRFGDHIDLGCGTIRGLDQAKRAAEAGARFLVSPTCIHEDVAQWCDDSGIAYIPGAATPSEIEWAWTNLNPRMVKVFPSQGPGFIEIIRDPLPKGGENAVQLIVSGGVNADTVGRFFEKGVNAACAGGSTFGRPPEINRDLKERLTKFVENAKPAIERFLA